MKEKEVIEDVPTKIAHGDHPEGAVNLEVRRITSENLTTSVAWMFWSLSQGSLPTALIGQGRRRCDFNCLGVV
jgi:hypothetical protein